MSATSQVDPAAPSPQVRKRSPFYRPELDGLRFFAFLVVFGRHITDHPAAYYAAHQIPAWACKLILALSDAGAHGVDLFFVLSAYLITELLLREKEEQGSLHVKSFYLRRILRIWPLYYAFITALAVASFFKSPHPFSLRDYLTYALLAGNWGVIAFHSRPWFAGPLWSVSIEEQFYLLWPPVVARLTRRHIVIAGLLLIAAANITRIVMLLAGCTNWQIYFSTLVRLDQIACGILLAALLHHRVPSLRLGVRLFLVSIAALSLVLTGFYNIRHEDLPTWTQMLVCYPVAAAACALVVYAVLGMGMQSAFLRYLGKISYGLYVFHMACIMFADKHVHVHAGIVNALLRPAVALALTLLVASLSYRFLESPFLQLKKRFTFVNSRPV